jgi:hypothetical protein
MFFLSVSLVLLILFLTGAGYLFGKLLGLTFTRNPWLYFWLGIFITSVITMFVSLFAPVDLRCLLIFVLIGGCGLLFWWPKYRRLIRQQNSGEIKIYRYALFLFFFSLTCLLAYIEWTGSAGDTDLYHAQIVRWYNEYGAAPGIGNLHARLAFNSAWHALAALFDNGFWDARSAWLMPGLWILGGFFYFLYEFCFAQKNGARFYALAMLIWLGITTIRVAPGLYYDNPVHILNAIVVLEAYYLLSSLAGSVDNSKRQINAMSAAVLSLGAGAFIIKPMGIITLLFSGMLICFVSCKKYRMRNNDIGQMFGALLKIGAPALIAVSVWVVKNIFLSGYILYPLPVFSLSLDWTMPLYLVKENYDAVVGWARMPGINYRQALNNGFFFWFKPWLSRNLHSLAFLTLPILSGLLWIFNINYRRNIKVMFYFLVWSIVAILYWFLSAPDMRFGEGFFWTAIATAFLFVVPNGFDLPLGKIWTSARLRCFFLICGCGVILTGASLAIISPIRHLLYIGFHPARPVQKVTVNDGANPFSVWVPLDETDDRTGNSPLPSAPAKPVNLEMREPRDLNKGFRSRK